VKAGLLRRRRRHLRSNGFLNYSVREARLISVLGAASALSDPNTPGGSSVASDLEGRTSSPQFMPLTQRLGSDHRQAEAVGRTTTALADPFRRSPYRDPDTPNSSPCLTSKRPLSILDCAAQRPTQLHVRVPPATFTCPHQLPASEGRSPFGLLVASF
jgi:hypothetical protein